MLQIYTEEKCPDWIKSKCRLFVRTTNGVYYTYEKRIENGVIYFIVTDKLLTQTEVYDFVQSKEFVRCIGI